MLKTILNFDAFYCESGNITIISLIFEKTNICVYND